VPTEDTYVGRSPISGEPVRIFTSEGAVTAIEPTPDQPQARWISPGWIDLQVNGYAGVDYNATSTAQEEIAQSIQAQRKAGVTRLLPTVITGDLNDMAACLRNLAASQQSMPAIAGFHVEGPWISPDDGPRGAHPLEHVRPASIEEFKRLQDAALGQIRLLTLAPESPGALALIEYAVGGGVIVAIGHTGATTGQIDDAVSAGASMSTHIGNGAHSTLNKNDSYVFRQMAEDKLYAGLIVDGIHLTPDFVRIAVRTKGLDRCVLVTDAVAPAGCEPGFHSLGGQTVELLGDGRVQLPSGRLAGSSLSMDRAISNVMRFAGVSLEQALRMASSNAAQAIGLDERTGFLELGDAAEFVSFDIDPAGNIRVM
jgi:N-acetylglucosamine-6-phosphate deacetylase